MNQLTTKLDSDRVYCVDVSLVVHDANGCCGDAINKLGKFEDFYDDLITKQEAIARELDQLRLEDKKRTVKFKQLLAEKLTNQNILILFKRYGLE